MPGYPLVQPHSKPYILPTPAFHSVRPVAEVYLKRAQGLNGDDRRAAQDKRREETSLVGSHKSAVDRYLKIARGPSEIEKLAAYAQREAGMLAPHTLAIQKLCETRDLVICIRPVSREAAEFIQEGRGTKDMSIKAKSSNLPPLNALIPFDQRYGKKGADEALAKAFTDKNREAIAQKLATAVDAEISVNRLRYLREATGRLEIHGTWINHHEGEGLLVGRDHGKDYHFWGVKRGDTVKIHEAVATLPLDGTWRKGEAVKVMANRQQMAVTADYDLALVMVNLKEFDSKHTLPLPVSTFEEASRRNISLGKDQASFNETVKHILDVNSEDYDPEVEVDGFSAKDVNRPAIENEMLAYIKDNCDKSTFEQVKGDKEFLSEYFKMYVDRERAELVKKKLLPGNIPRRSLGITSSFVRNLIPLLNSTVGRKSGQEVFHHGEDSGNPFSEENDNYPMTVILPTSASQGEDVIRIIRNSKELAKLLQTLKNLGFHTQINERWDKKLYKVKRDSFNMVRERVFGEADGEPHSILRAKMRSNIEKLASDTSPSGSSRRPVRRPARHFGDKRIPKLVQLLFDPCDIQRP